MFVKHVNNENDRDNDQLPCSECGGFDLHAHTDTGGGECDT